MESKYYTPEIEEFHVGFEFEWTNCKTIDWHKASLKFIGNDTFMYFFTSNQTRVKLLDREDAESLGYVFDNKLSIGFIRLENGYSYSISGIYGTDQDSISIAEINEKGNVQFLFHGKIKNKSELQKLLIQLGIK